MYFAVSPSIDSRIGPKIKFRSPSLAIMIAIKTSAIRKMDVNSISPFLTRSSAARYP